MRAVLVINWMFASVHEKKEKEKEKEKKGKKKKRKKEKKKKKLTESFSMGSSFFAWPAEIA